MSGEVIVFWFCAIFAVSGAVGLVISRKTVHSALWVAFTMINLAILYFAQGAPFLGTTQVVVYTGAIMMLFLFVIMIVGVDSSDSLMETIRGQRALAIIVGLAFGAVLLSAITNTLPATVTGIEGANGAHNGNMQGLANLIFGRYLLAFEVTSALLITAAIGAMVLAHMERWQPRKTQPELMRERTMSGHPTPMPAPGVIAQHNSVATPGILPDGSYSQASLPTPFKSLADGEAPREVTGQ